MRRHASVLPVRSGSGRPTMSMGHSRVGKSRALLILLAAALAACLLPSTASAIVFSHPTLETFGSAEQPSFGRIVGMTVDQSNGDLLVLDSGAGTISRYHADGTPANFSALGSNVIDGHAGGADQTPEGDLSFGGSGEAEIAVDRSGGPTDGDIYVTQVARDLVDIFSEDGTHLGRLTEFRAGLSAQGALTHLGEACGVAVGPTGTVYVGDYAGYVHAYSPSVSPATNSDNTVNLARPSVCTLAAGTGATTGYVFANGYAEKTTKINVTTGKPQYEVSGEKASASAVNPATGRLLTAGPESGVREYDASGSAGATLVSRNTEPESSIAVDGTTGNVYVAGNSSTIAVLGPAFGVSVPEETPEELLTPSTATLHGTVNPNGFEVTDCKFEYGTNGKYGEVKPCEGATPADSSDHQVSASLSGLTPATEYSFRLSVTVDNGTVNRSSGIFRTSPKATTGKPTNTTGPTATLNGSVFPNGALFIDCKFEYASQGEIEKAHEERVQKEKEKQEKEEELEEPIEEEIVERDPYLTTPCAESPASIGEGFNLVNVHADIEGLSFETTYRYRLIATDADGAIVGQDRTFKVGAPVVASQFVTGVTNTEAKLHSAIIPQRLPTTYHFEYGTTDAYGQSTAELEVGADEQEHTMTNILEGLAPDTTYHWRVVATNSHAVTDGIDRTFTTFPVFSPESDCPNQALRTGASAALPDCRAYEMVSPQAKAGEVYPPNLSNATCGECTPGILGAKMAMQASPDGEAIAFEGQPFFAGVASRDNQYLAHRSAGGWRTEGVSSPLTSPRGGAYQFFSADLSRGVFHQIEPVLSPEAPSKEGKAYANLYLHEEGAGPRPLVNQAPPNRGPGDPEQSAPDPFEITFGGGNSGTQSTPAFSHLIFEANDALTGATASAPAAVDGGFSGTNLYEWIDGQLSLVNVLPGNTATAPGAVIGSGFLEIREPSYEPPVFEHAISDDGSHIFWSDGESGQVYVRIDGEETQKIEDPGKFLTAAADGSKVLLSDGCLYDLATEECEDLTGGEGGFQGILGSAEDLSRVYFVDTAALTPPGEENANHEHAEDGKFNLYGWHEGAISFIAVLDGNGFHRGDNDLPGYGLSRGGDWMAAARNRTAQVSPDGRYLAFMSRAPLTGYDNLQDSQVATNNRTACAEPERSAQPGCAEVFEYDAATASLSCASCNPSGERPLGRSNLTLLMVQENNAPSPPLGNLSAGGRIFFESQDALTTSDTNGQIQDVYEWKPSGVGGCSRAGGCVALISSGQGPNDSFFVDSTPSGSDAFFITRDQLLLKDQDEMLDLYDARAGGGIAEGGAPPCLGEACKGPASSAPEQQSPGSAGFVGPGNEKPKKQSKHHKHKKSHKKTHKHKSKAHKRAAKHNSGGSK